LIPNACRSMGVLNGGANGDSGMSGKLAMSLVVMTGLLAGCTGLPAEGPSALAVKQRNHTGNPAGYKVVPVTGEVAKYLSQQPEQNFGDRFGKGKPAAADRIGPGDELLVRIWEADPVGLFGPAGLVDKGSIPVTVVDAKGNVHIPYAGRIKAAGLTTTRLAEVIAEKLKSIAVEPQVQVSITKPVANLVTVSGEVNSPGLYPLSVRGDDLLDVIAAAGGSKHASYDTVVRVTRGKIAGETRLEHIQKTDADNVYVQPGDQITLERRPWTFSAFGAVRRTGRFEFGAPRLNLMEAVGMVAGLDDQRADTRGVFLFRYEPADVAARLLGTENGGGDPSAEVAVVYQINFKDAAQYFLAQSVAMKDQDVIYVSTSSAAELAKFVSLLNPTYGIARTAVVP
jgi:polysaccharide export outer membrane protein